MNEGTIHRIFDDGSRHFVDTGEPGGLVSLDIYFCGHLECTCRETPLVASRLEPSPTNTFQEVGVPIEGMFHLDSGSLTIPPEVTLSDPELASLFHRALRPEVVDFLRARWTRHRRLLRDDEWRTVDWTNVDLSAMVPFLDIFPSRWDLSVNLDRRCYWAIDLWCMDRRCTCSETIVEFLEESGKRLGAARLDLDHLSVIAIEGSDPRLRPLSAAFLDDRTNREELSSRRKLVKTVSRELPRHLASLRASPTPLEPGRNSSCPCGSGKRFKRCCGR